MIWYRSVKGHRYISAQLRTHTHHTCTPIRTLVLYVLHFIYLYLKKTKVAITFAYRAGKFKINFFFLIATHMAPGRGILRRGAGVGSCC